MKIGALIESVSRKATGRFTSARRLWQEAEASGRAQVEVFAPRDEWSLEDRPAWEPLPVHLFDVRGSRSFKYTPGLLDSLAERECDALHVHGLWTYLSVASSRWSRRTGRPFVVSPHGQLDPWALRYKAWKKRLALAAYQLPNLRRAACVRSLCSSETEAIRSLGLRNPVCEIPNGVDLPGEVMAGPPWEGIVPAGAKVLLCLGRLSPQKRQLQLLEAWAKVQRGERVLTEEWWLAVAGWDQDGYEAELRAFVESEAVRKVAFLGPLFGEKKAAAFGRAEAFVLPSISEGLPMVVLEAWSYGLPVLMTDECHLPEGFAGGAAVRITPDFGGMPAGLDQLLSMSDPDRRAMGGRGRLLVSERFSWPSIASRMMDVYGWLAGGGPAPESVSLA